MKQIILLLTCALCLCACSSNDDDNSVLRDSRLIGTWETENKDDAITFNSNGTVTENENDGGRDISLFLDKSFDEWFESITLYNWEGEWTTTDNRKLHLHWKTGKYLKVSKIATWKDIADAEETVTINYTISQDGKTLIEGDMEGEQHSVPKYYYKK